MRRGEDTDERTHQGRGNRHPAQPCLVSSVCVYCETKDIQICISNFHLNFKSKFLFSSKALIILHINYWALKEQKTDNI